METMVLDRDSSTYLINAASVVRSGEQMAEVAKAAKDDWTLDKSNPYVKWIAGDFVEADNPNRNTQFWTAGDLELSEYSILHAPLNMVHKFRTPVGFFAATKQVKLEKPKLEAAEIALLDQLEAGATLDSVVAEAAAAKKKAAVDQGSMKIEALSGMWSHIFGFEAAQVDAADDLGLLFYSMECRGTHLVCGTDEARKLEGCGKKFDYLDVANHCEHLLNRSSVRHIVSPTFRGGALIVPPVKPGWQKATASVVNDAVMQEAAAFAAQHEDQYNTLNAEGADLTASAWEQIMGLVVANAPAVR